MKGKIIQDAKLYLQLEGEEKIRHIRHWPDYEKICKELGISTSKRTYLVNMPPIEQPDITEWPEKEVEVGPMRVIWFSERDEENFRRIKEVGFNTILCGNLRYFRPYEEYLDLAESHNIKVIGSIHNGEDFWRHKDRVRDFILSIKNHPAYIGSFPIDEPQYQRISKAEQIDLYKFIKNVDPDHDVYGSAYGRATPELWEEYFTEEAFDALLFYIYVYDKEIPDPAAYQEKQMGLLDGHGDYLVIPLAQAFYGGRFLNPAGHISEIVDRYINRGLCSGGFGFYTWAWTGGTGISGDSNLYNEVKEVNKKSRIS